MELRHTELITVENLWRVGTTPMAFEYVEDGREFVTEACLESAWIYPPGGERRPLTAAEIEWVDENHPGWVVKMANEEHSPDRYDPEVPSCDYFGTLRYM